MEKQRMRYLLETIIDPIKLRKKLLLLVEECGKLSGENDFGWALLAKLVYACDQEMLRTISSRIQKRLIAAAKQPITIPLLHFVRSFLVRFQWLKGFNELTLAYICSRAVDFSVENCSKNITRLTSNIYALWARTKYDYILIKALKNMFTDVTVENNDESEKVLFRFETSVQRYLPQFISTIFNLHNEVMEWCSPDDKVAINEWLDVARESATMVEAENLDSIFRWLRTFMLKAKSCAYLVVRRISSFISDFYRPSEAYYEVVKEYVQLGPDSSVNALFRTFISSAKCQLHSQEYGIAYAKALGAMLELRPYLLEVQDVIELQHVVCREAFLNRNCKPALSLLNSLLSMNNELVPSPVQIAHSIFSGSENWCDEVRLGRALCSSISRPRIQIVVPHGELLKKLTDILMSDQQIRLGDCQNPSELRAAKKSPSDSTAISKELVSNNPVASYENVIMESVEGVRKRTHPSEEKTTGKHLRIGSDWAEEMFSSESESSQSSETGIAVEEQISEKAGPTLVEQEEVQKTVVNATARKLDSHFEITVLEKDIINHELTVEQMMADFVPD